MNATIRSDFPPGAGCEAEVRLLVPSDLALVERAIEVIAEQLEARFAGSRTIRFNLRVALTEALANAILYGNGEDPAKSVELRVAWGAEHIEAVVTDEGAGFDPTIVPDPTLPERLSAEDGRGLFLIRQLMDEVRYNEKGNSVWMTVRRA